MGLCWKLAERDVILIELLDLGLTIPVRIEQVGRAVLVFSIEPYEIQFRLGEVRGARAEVEIDAPRSKVGLEISHSAA